MKSSHQIELFSFHCSPSVQSKSDRGSKERWVSHFYSDICCTRILISDQFHWLAVEVEGEIIALKRIKGQLFKYIFVLRTRAVQKFNGLSFRHALLPVRNSERLLRNKWSGKFLHSPASHILFVSSSSSKTPTFSAEKYWIYHPGMYVATYNHMHFVWEIVFI